MFEIWNEPNGKQFLANPAIYPRLLRAALDAIRREDPDAAVSTGGTSGIDLPFLTHMLESGSANHLSKIGKQKPGLKVNLEKAVGAIMEAMSPEGDPFPASLPDKSQALFGLGYSFQDQWGVSGSTFTAFTLGTLVVIVLISVVGYFQATSVRSNEVAVALAPT